LSFAEFGANFADKLANLLYHKSPKRCRLVSGQEGLEPPTGGFGDRCSTS
jgi:hypothetical protein